MFSLSYFVQCLNAFLRIEVGKPTSLKIAGRTDPEQKVVLFCGRSSPGGGLCTPAEKR